MARDISSRFHVGTASWANPPTERKHRSEDMSHLAYYAKTFNFVEINSSFYRAHRRATYERWCALTPADFSFAVKLPRSVTHQCALRHCRAELGQFLTEVEGLGHKLRADLVQLPASLAYDGGVAARFFKHLTAACHSQVVCEPRHASWFSKRADALLRRHGIARVAADPARVPGAESPGGSKRLAYYRLHGSPKIYYSAYSADFLNHLAIQLRALSEATGDVCCAFDNTARYEAWPNALQLLARLRKSQAPNGRTSRKPTRLTDFEPDSVPERRWDKSAAAV